MNVPDEYLEQGDWAPFADDLLDAPACVSSGDITDSDSSSDELLPIKAQRSKSSALKGLFPEQDIDGGGVVNEDVDADAAGAGGWESKNGSDGEEGGESGLKLEPPTLAVAKRRAAEERNRLAESDASVLRRELLRLERAEGPSAKTRVLERLFSLPGGSPPPPDPSESFGSSSFVTGNTSTRRGVMGGIRRALRSAETVGTNGTSGNVGNNADGNVDVDPRVDHSHSRNQRRQLETDGKDHFFGAGGGGNAEQRAVPLRDALLEEPAAALPPSLRSVANVREVVRMAAAGQKRKTGQNSNAGKSAGKTSPGKGEAGNGSPQSPFGAGMSPIPGGRRKEYVGRQCQSKGLEAIRRAMSASPARVSSPIPASPMRRGSLTGADGSRLPPLPSPIMSHSINSSHAITTTAVALAAAADGGGQSLSSAWIDHQAAIFSNATEGTASTALPVLLYLSRCRDLSLPPSLSSYKTFHESLSARSQWPHFDLRGMGLGTLGACAIAIGAVSGDDSFAIGNGSAKSVIDSPRGVGNGNGNGTDGGNDGSENGGGGNDGGENGGATDATRPHLSPAFVSLDASSNPLGDTGLVILSRAIPNSSLTSLSLLGCGGGDTGIGAVLQAVCESRTITSLDISGVAKGGPATGARNRAGVAAMECLRSALYKMSAPSPLREFENRGGTVAAPQLPPTKDETADADGDGDENEHDNDDDDDDDENDDADSPSPSSSSSSSLSGAEVGESAEMKTKQRRVRVDPEAHRALQSPGGGSVLASLSFASLSLPPAAIPTLSRALRYATALTELDLSGNVLGAAGYRALFEGLSSPLRLYERSPHPSLPPPPIDGTALPPPTRQLLPTPPLRVLNLSRTCPTVDGLLSLGIYLSHSQLLRNLVLRDCGCDGPGVRAVTRGLVEGFSPGQWGDAWPPDEETGGVRSMRRGGYYEDEDGGLRIGGGIETLDLSDNTGIGKDGTKWIAQAIEAPGSTLTNLNLSHCGLEAPSAIILGDSLASCPRLKSLILRGNPLGDAGVVNLGQGILRGTSQGRAKAAGLAVWGATSLLHTSASYSTTLGKGNSNINGKGKGKGSVKEETEEKEDGNGGGEKRKGRARGLTVEAIEAAKARGVVPIGKNNYPTGDVPPDPFSSGEGTAAEQRRVQLEEAAAREAEAAAFDDANGGKGKSTGGVSFADMAVVSKIAPGTSTAAPPPPPALPLSHLDLSSTSMTDKGLITLCRCLVRASCLESLDIRDAQLTDAGGAALLTLLNAVRDRNAVAGGVTSPPLLTSLSMGHCGVSYGPHTDIQKALRNNRRQHEEQAEQRLYTQLTRAAHTLQKSEAKRQALHRLSQAVADLHSTAERLRRENLERRKTAQVEAQALREEVRVTREELRANQGLMEEMTSKMHSTRTEMEGALGSLRRQIDEARADTVAKQRELLQCARRIEERTDKEDEAAALMALESATAETTLARRYLNDLVDKCEAMGIPAAAFEKVASGQLTVVEMVDLATAGKLKGERTKGRIRVKKKRTTAELK